MRYPPTPPLAAADRDPLAGRMIHATTVVGVRKNGAVAVAGDGQVTMQNMVVKGGAKKVRRLFDGKVLTGFAGGAADAMALFERLEAKLQAHGGNLRRSAVEMAKDWRTDRYLRRLEALLIAADRETMLLISGQGDVIEPDEGILAIGSGGGFALAAAKALYGIEGLDARTIAERALKIAGDICVFTNGNIQVETLE